MVDTTAIDLFLGLDLGTEFHHAHSRTEDGRTGQVRGRDRSTGGNRNGLVLRGPGTQTKRAALRVLDSVTAVVEQRLKLKVNRDKSNHGR